MPNWKHHLGKKSTDLGPDVAESWVLHYDSGKTRALVTKAGGRYWPEDGECTAQHLAGSPSEVRTQIEDLILLET